MTEFKVDCATALSVPGFQTSPAERVAVPPTPTPTVSATPTLTIAPTPAPVCPDQPLGKCRPYNSSGPWNTRIGDNPAVHPKSAKLVAAIADNGLPLTSDPDQYAQPVYLSDATTPRRPVQFSGYYSTYDDGDDSRVGHGFAPLILDLPIAEEVQPSEGTDGQVVIWDPVEATEYGFWRFERAAGGNYFAQNGYGNSVNSVMANVRRKRG